MSRTCSCAVSRREFVAMMGISAAALLASPGWARWIEKQAPPDELARWKVDLFQPSAPRKYLSAVHKDVHLPLGGIGTGSFELGADGNLTTWHIWNNLREGHVPLHFAARVGEKARLLQTAGGPNWPRVQSIEMVGEYPTAELRYTDTALPLDLDMTAFSPFMPLDSRLASMPAAVFAFKAHNRTAEPQTVALAAFTQNMIGYEGIGELRDGAHPDLDGAINNVDGGANYAGVLMSAKRASSGEFIKPVNVYTNANLDYLNSPASDHPKGLSYNPLDRLPAPEQLGESVTLVVLEDAPVDISAASLLRIGAVAQAGARVAFTGKSQPLLTSYGALTGGKPLAQATGAPDIVFENFEAGYDAWKVEGDAFGDKPATGTGTGQQRVSGFKGKGLVNTWNGSDEGTGKLTSREFTVERHFIRFLIGGGQWPTTQIRLVVDGKVVRSQSGRDEEMLQPVMWDVSEFIGKTAHIEIVDEQKGPWGHVNVDEIVFTDEPGDRAVMEALEQLLPMRFSDYRAMVSAEGKRTDILSFNAATLSVTQLTRSRGKGSVTLCTDAVLPTDHTVHLNDRRNCHALVAALASTRYSRPDGVPSNAHGSGTVALGCVDNSSGEITVAAHNTMDNNWLQFVEEGRFEDTTTSIITKAAQSPTAAVGISFTVPPGKTVEAVFFYAWHYPNRYSGGQNVGNFYTTLWQDAKAVARELSANLPAIRARMQSFRSTVYASTMPYWLTDCITSQMSTIRHPGIVFQLAKGDIYGWEGSNGCCQPTCAHVWGYEQSLAYLFPDLEQVMRLIDYKHQQGENGGINNRTDFPSPPHPTGERPFTDGHASCVLKAYREAINQPDDKWMREYWPLIKKAVDYLVDRDAAGGEPDGVLEDDQWNTYDEAVHGVTTFIGAYYLAALRAGEELAKRMGDSATAARYRAIFEKGSKKLDEMCWNGEYYQQNLPDYMQRNGEYGPGCLADQLIGQWWAHQLGLGYLLPKERVQQALKSVFRYNWLPDHTNWKHNWRKFAGGKDKGLLICSWPKGGRPASPILYCDEVWTGVEYQVASHMIYEGLIEEAFCVIKGARDRYNGIPRDPMGRNPWNEIECGGHYARAMSSWSLLHALNGYRFDGPRGALRFAVAHKPEDHRSFFVAGTGWGSYRQKRSGAKQTSEVRVVEGKLQLNELRLATPHPAAKASVRRNGAAVKATVAPGPEGVTITFAQPLTLAHGDALTVQA